MSEVKMISLKDIRLNKESLRTVNQKTVEYQELVQSIKNNGVLNAINVAPSVDPETQQPFYTLVDGLQRFTASQAAGLAEIPAVIMPASQIEILKRQIITNSTRVETKPVEYSKQLNRILDLDPLVSVASLAASLNKSEMWLKERLNLSKLTPELGSLVDEGVINVTNATTLAKLPPEEQAAFQQAAMTMSPQEFIPLITAKRKELSKAKQEGRSPTGADFVPVARLQKMGDIRTEIDTCTIGNTLIGQNNLRTAQDGWKAALEWSLHLDPLSVAEAKQKYQETQAASAEKKAKSELERAEKKAQASSVRAERQKLIFDTMNAGGDVEAVLKEFDAKHGKAAEQVATA